MDATAPSMDSRTKSSGLLMKALAIQLCPFYAQVHIYRSYGPGGHYAEQKSGSILLTSHIAMQAAAHACTAGNGSRIVERPSREQCSGNSTSGDESRPSPIAEGHLKRAAGHSTGKALALQSRLPMAVAIPPDRIMKHESE